MNTISTKKYSLKLLVVLIISLFVSSIAISQNKWLGKLQRKDSIEIPVRFEITKQNDRTVWNIINGDEKIKVDSINTAGDSLLIQMPVFESQFRVKAGKSVIKGLWIKGGAIKTTALPFYAETEKGTALNKKAIFNISGRWAVNFSNSKKNELSVGEFKQTGNKLIGTFLNPSGDYRYLEGIVKEDSLLLSGFDGGHSYLFIAKIENKITISNGIFYSGATYKESWSATKDPTATVSQESVAMFLKPGEESLHFTFKDLQGKNVSIQDDRFKNKVVIVQLMGSWCPNCMDETAFLSEYYNNNKQRCVEVIALAYEYTTNWERSVKSLQKFRQRFDVQYTILNTEVAVTDSLRTEKTLPELTAIKFFPSSVIIDKKGKIRKLDTGFNGPATGSHYFTYKKEFEETVTSLLKEN